MLPAALSPAPSLSPWILTLTSGRVEETEVAPFYKGGNRGPREFLDIGKATQLACPGVSGGAGKPLRPQSPGIVWPPAAPQPPQRDVLEVEQPEAGQSQATVSGRVAS